jgi:hypothetical protein
MKVSTSPKIKPVRPAKLGAVKRAKKSEPGSSYDAVMKLIKWADEIPEETWASVPKDASKQLKHYMYGSPRVPD